MGIEIFQSLVNRLRKKDNVVGVWAAVDPKTGVAVTAELSNGKGRQVKIDGTGAVTSTSHGKVIKRRVNRGRPNADTIYVADEGEETMLESREF